MLLAAAFAQEVRRVNGDVVASQIRPMKQSLNNAVGPRRFSGSVMAACLTANRTRQQIP
jgi:hypothetical protein